MLFKVFPAFLGVCHIDSGNQLVMPYGQTFLKNIKWNNP